MISEIIEKATVANAISAVVVLSALAYAIWQKNGELVALIAGAGIGYLFPKKSE